MRFKNNGKEFLIFKNARKKYFLILNNSYKYSPWFTLIGLTSRTVIFLFPLYFSFLFLPFFWQRESSKRWLCWWEAIFILISPLYHLIEFRYPNTDQISSLNNGLSLNSKQTDVETREIPKALSVDRAFYYSSRSFHFIGCPGVYPSQNNTGKGRRVRSLSFFYKVAESYYKF